LADVCRLGARLMHQLRQCQLMLLALVGKTHIPE
jgi:hypothetical protein